MPPTTPAHDSILERISFAIVNTLQKSFYKWGVLVARYPYHTILTCVSIAAIFSLGLLKFKPENRPDKLWIPWNSEFVRDTDWLRQHFPSPIRFHHAILTADDVLQPNIVALLIHIHEEVNRIDVQGRQWKDICFKLPVTKDWMPRRRRRQVSSNDDFDFDTVNETQTNFGDEMIDPSVLLGNEAYCYILSNLEEACWEKNIAELWNFDKKSLDAQSKNEILDIINSKTTSPIFGRPVNYTTELGDISRNATGHIVQARAIKIAWFASINQTALQSGDNLHDLGTGEIVDEINLLWESELITVLRKTHLPDGVKLFINVARSFGDIGGATIRGDVSMLVLGFSVMFIYVVFMLGNCNMIHQRPFLAIAGLSCVGMAVGVAYGLCSFFGLIYSPIHNILPFLLLGIGIDDMFVIMQCFNNLTPEEQKRSLPERIGLTLQHGVVSITVTSVTDFAAFAIGGTTVLPALQSFCIFAAVGLGSIYIFQATFFIAALVLDQSRLESRRNALFPCHIHPEYELPECSKVHWAQLMFSLVISNILLKLPVKVIAIVLTTTLVSFGIWGTVLLRQEFNPIWFLPQDSYLFQYFMSKELYFPGQGEQGFIIFENADLPSKMAEFDNLTTSLFKSKYIFETDSWFVPFKTFSYRNCRLNISGNSVSEKPFKKCLSRFLFSPVGSRFRSKFLFVGNALKCGKPAPDVRLSLIDFKFRKFSGPEEHLPAMREIKILTSGSNITTKTDGHPGHSFAWSFAFAGWETDEIITTELYKNMSLALICILATTLLLLANIGASLLVFLCVLLTLVDVGGFMHFWGLTIDTVSCIDLVLAIGLCVDYAAHIGHAFMTCSGSKNERVKKALVTMGPAVLNGGFSTFLAFVLLANSKSHVFITFFKIFTLVVIFGLFHGLIFLPVILTFIGPKSYKLVDDRVSSPNRTEEQYNEEQVELNPPNVL